jgi:uncharacterized protein YidB (DUF937 family)
MEESTNPLTTAAGGDPTAAVAGLDQAIQGAGGLDGLLAKLRAGGLGDEVDSWVSTGTNADVEPDRLATALGPDTVQKLSAGSGLDLKQLLPLLAMFLPQIIDALTPKGQVPSGGLNGATGGGLGDLGGILGGVLGGGTGSGSPDLGGVLGGILGGDKPR